MMVRSMIPANGMQAAGRGEVATAPGRSSAEGPSPLGRLIQIMRGNDDLMGRLEVQGRRLARARAYAVDPDANPALATALVEHERAGYANLLGTLRANRVEALGILRACGHADVPANP